VKTITGCFPSILNCSRTILYIAPASKASLMVDCGFARFPMPMNGYSIEIARTSTNCSRGIVEKSSLNARHIVSKASVQVCLLVPFGRFTCPKNSISHLFDTAPIPIHSKLGSIPSVVYFGASLFPKPIPLLDAPALLFAFIFLIL